jgi:hypothetical protein
MKTPPSSPGLPGFELELVPAHEPVDEQEDAHEPEAKDSPAAILREMAGVLGVGTDQEGWQIRVREFVRCLVHNADGEPYIGEPAHWLLELRREANQLHYLLREAGGKRIKPLSDINPEEA